MRASVTIHVETLWTNRAELMLEAELDNPHSETNQQVVSMMFEAARLMAERRAERTSAPCSVRTRSTRGIANWTNERCGWTSATSA